jgi:predicted phage terminase large subunit-like protein
MQNPVPDEGGILKKSWFRIWDEVDPPHCDFIIQTLDTAFSTRTTADFSVIQTWGIFVTVEKDSDGVERDIGNLILLGNIRGRFEYPELRQNAQDAYEDHQPDMVIIEKKASGQSLIQDLRRAGLPVLEYTPDRDKVARAYAASPLLEAGRVWLPNKIWAQTLFDEAISFPNAAHDDQVDAMVMAVHYMKDSWHLQHPHGS